MESFPTNTESVRRLIAINSLIFGLNHLDFILKKFDPKNEEKSHLEIHSSSFEWF